MFKKKINRGRQVKFLRQQTYINHQHLLQTGVEGHGNL